MSRAITTDTGPFAIVPEWLLDLPVSDRAIRLYAVLGRFADKNGECHPSRRLLADKLACSPNSLDRAKTELVGVGALEVEARFSPDGDPTSNRYIVRRSPPAGRGGPTGGETGGPTDGEQTRTTMNENLSPKGERAPDPVWDSLEARFGRAPAARRFRGAWNAAAQSLRADGWDGAEPALSALEGVYHRLFEGAALTPTALAKHYTALVHELGQGGGGGRRFECPECGLRFTSERRLGEHRETVHDVGVAA